MTVAASPVAELALGAARHPLSRTQEATRAVMTHRPRGFAQTLFVALVAAVLVFPIVAPSPLRAGAALATVANGLTTTDLNAIGMTADMLATDLAGTGVSVSNVTFKGAYAQAGRIHLADPAVVSFNDGVILSSGNIADIAGPNKSDGITGDMAGQLGVNAGAADTDLTALIAGSQTVNPMTYDATVLEFDFVPSASKVYFTYTFGSDEYLEWVNLFNDVFAFYVNGVNCATVPGGPVSIDSINDTINPTLFRDNSFSNPPPNPINIESDGLSVELICQADVNPGVTNHMKLAIADTSDQILDSIVVIKANSLSTIPPESCNDGVDNDADTLVDMNDDFCTSTTTPPPTGGGGVGSGGSAPAFTGNEGTPILLDAAVLGWTTEGAAVGTSWQVTGINGTPGSCTISPVGVQPIVAGLIAQAWATCPNEGEYVARVDGWDALVGGGSEFDKDVDFFVHNAPPSVDIGTPTSGDTPAPGDTVDLIAAVADPGVDDAITCDIDWGDGTSEAGTYNSGAGECTGSHVYAATGGLLVSVTATDDAGDSAADAAVITVTGVDPTPTPTPTPDPTPTPSPTPDPTPTPSPTPDPTPTPSPTPDPTPTPSPTPDPTPTPSPTPDPTPTPSPTPEPTPTPSPTPDPTPTPSPTPSPSPTPTPTPTPTPSPTPTPPGQMMLTVSKGGTGDGTVGSSPGGIRCGSDCTELYVSGRLVTLTATPAAGSRFAGWTGACSGIASRCTVTMSQARSAAAMFRLMPLLAYTGPDAAITGGTVGLAATLETPGGVPIAGKSVTFRIGSGPLMSATTDGTGTASISTTAPSLHGDYQLRVAFAGDADYAASTSLSATLLVRDATTLTVTDAQCSARHSCVITVRLMAGGSPASWVSGIRVVVAGHSYRASTTNGAGVATVRITAPSHAGSYPIVASWSGDGSRAPALGAGTLSVN